MSNAEGRLEADVRPQKRLLSRVLSKKVPPIPLDDERKPYPHKSANIISQIFFWWLFPVMNAGYKRTLTSQDLFTLPDDVKVETMANKFYKSFEIRSSKARVKHIQKKCKARGENLGNSSVDAEDDLADYQLPKTVPIFALLDTFWWQYLTASIFLVLANGGMTCNPLLSKHLIKYVELKAYGHETGVGKGVGYALGSAGVILVTGLCINHFFYRSMLTGAQAKAVLTKALLDKSFRLNAEARHKYPTSKITSMMGTDLARIDFALGFQPFLFVFPIPVAIAIAILIINVGAVSLIGVALLFIFMIAITLSTVKLFKYRAKANAFTDRRVDYIKEVLNNLKIIKFYSWEPPYHDGITEVRRKEMKIIYSMQVLRNIVTAFAMSLTLFASMVCFLVLYAVKSKSRDPAAIFSSVSLFNVLTQQVIMLPMALNSGVDAYIGITRVGAFMDAGEIDHKDTKIEAEGDNLNHMIEANDAIRVQNGHFEWETFEQDNEEEDKKKDKAGEASKEDSTQEKIKGDDKSEGKTSDDDSSTLEEKSFVGLKKINLTVKKGEFVVITGLIGSGKSSLLSALAGFMKKSEGTLAVNGSLLLCGYPWVQNATVKENILFGNEFNEERYKDVVYSCSLESDLDILPAGDRTEIGERGITLSGGQKARINLARAVYANKDIILMDDVLSAVDARVGKHIMENCFSRMLGDKTRILATHQLSLIGNADRVVFLNGDGSIEIGTFEELSSSNAGFQKLMAFNSDSQSSKDDSSELIEDADDNEVRSLAYEKYEEDEERELEREMIQRQISKRSSIKTNEIDEEALHRDYNKDKTGDGKLFMDEEKAENQISFEVYKNYAKYGSGVFKNYGIVPIVFLTCVLATFCQIFTNTWLSFWTEHRFNGRNDAFYIGLYIMFTFLSFVMLTTEFVFLVYMTNTASVKLNIMAVKRILHAPMSFMDTTPMGRILNRFTKDTDVLDNEIGDQMRFLLFTFANIVGVIILCICYLPWFAIAVPFLGFIFVAMANYYQASAREIKRLEAVKRSFVYNNFNETLSGMATIKAFKAANRFLNKNNTFLNNTNEAYFINIANQRWLAIHLDILACVFALIIALLCVFRVFSISAASVGLLTSYVFQIAGQLSMLIRTYTQVENEMNGVERLCEYAFKIPEEAPYLITENTPPKEWPQQGVVSFDKVNLSYRPELPLVLRDVSFDVKPMEKIGICGRTGAGKSSIMTALYRLSELQSGKIIIDGIDISTLGLQDLRSKLSIIPQDPVLFRGTIRKNLDPFGDYDDNKLWDALRRSGLIEGSKLEAVKEQDKDLPTLHKFHLDQGVEDEGSNFSLGERQLIAFGRALVRDSKILILDEATSSVDYETDSKIQATIVREFSQCTILCIAHRLKTIIDYDKILVLDKGEVREFDTPWNLFNLEDSIFQQMCKRSNITEQDFTRKESN